MNTTQRILLLHSRLRLFVVAQSLFIVVFGISRVPVQNVRVTVFFLLSAFLSSLTASRAIELIAYESIFGSRTILGTYSAFCVLFVVVCPITIALVTQSVFGIEVWSYGVFGVFGGYFFGIPVVMDELYKRVRSAREV